MGIATDITNGEILEKLSNLHLSNGNIVLGSSAAETNRIYVSNAAGTPLTHKEAKKVYRMYNYTGSITLTGS